MSLQVSTPSIHFNLAITLVNLNGDAGLLQAIAQIFAEDVPSMALALKEAFANGDDGEIVHLSHTIKGMASNFHAEPLTSLSRKLELDYVNLSVDQREALVLEIAEVCGQTINELKKEIGA